MGASIFYALEQSDQQFLATLKDSIRNGCRFTSDYSGMECFGGALAILQNEILHRGLSEVPSLHLVRSGDRSEISRKVLLGMKGPGSPHCVFGDMTISPRLKSSDKEMLESFVRQGHKTYTQCIGRGLKEREAVATSNAEVLSNAAQWMKDMNAQLTQDNRLDVKAWCYTCEKSCSVFLQPSSDSSLRAAVGGVECRDWSVRGNRRQLCGDTCVTFLQFLWERYKSDDDFFVIECTLHFDESAVEALVGDKFNVEAHTFSRGKPWSCRAVLPPRQRRQVKEPGHFPTYPQQTLADPSFHLCCF